MRPSPALAIVAAATLVGTLSSLAHADLPPPNGQKYVSYTFTVTGLAAAPDQVLFAFPCGTSAGAPIAQHQKIDEGKSVTVGRRGGGCTVYTISKAKYDAFAATYKPTNIGSDPALDALAKDSVKCDGGPNPKFDLPSSDPRDVIADTYAVKTLTAAACALSTTTPPPPPGPTGTTPPANPSATSTAPSGGGCSAAPGRTEQGLLLVAASLAFLGGALRRRARRS